MLHRLSIVLISAFAVSGALLSNDERVSALALTDQASPARNLQGAWKIIEVATRSPGGNWAISTPPHLSVYIFTSRHYSYMFAPGTGPRRLFVGDPNQPTDAEKVAAYDSIVAGSGTYDLTGSTLTLNAILHKNPNEMAGEALKYAVEIEGPVLRLTILNPPFAPGRERRTVLTRLE
jgi:Lipocalin-like domain